MRNTATPSGARRYGAPLLATLLVTAMGSSAPPAASPDLARSARGKVDRIESDQLRAGETVVLSEDEINSLLKYEYATYIPDGVRDPRVHLFDRQAVVHTYIDVAKLQRSTDGSMGLWGMLFSGERELKAVCRPISSGGRAKVEVESIQLSGSAISGSALEWLLSVTLGESDAGPANHLPLPENLRELRVEKGRAIVVAN